MTITPAMQQYYDLKAEYEDTILFFRMWDFYEMFAQDAEIAHQVLWINITSRNKNADTPIALAWIPYHALDKYLPMLVNAWYKVAIAEQVSDPKLKGIVKREVVRVVTPATLSLEWETYENQDSNNIICITENKWAYGMSVVELSTNTWKTGFFQNIEKLSSEIYKNYPKEVILSKNLFQNQDIQELLVKKFQLNVYYFEWPKNPRKKLLQHFWTKNLHAFGIEDKEDCIVSSATLLEYLAHNQKTSLSHLDTLSYTAFDWYLELDESTIRNLDIVYNIATWSQKNGTLFWVLDKTKTSVWKRMLRDNLLRPFYNKERIEKRQKFVQEFVDDKVLLDSVQNELAKISDIDAILTRISVWRSGARDLLRLKDSLVSIKTVCGIIEKSENKKLISLLH